MRIGAIKITISRCTTGIYLRWWFNGWHYFNFVNGYEIVMNTASFDTQVTRFFSIISKIERTTRLKAEYSYLISIEGIAPQNIGGFTGLIMAEKVEQYEGGIWREVEITRGTHLIRDAGEQGFEISFIVTRKELPESSSVFQKSLELYLGDTLCDMDDDEVVPINKQTNDISEMQDRQSDFTAQFKIRKTRAMRALFELSGEVGANTTFPFEEQLCRLIQDHIEVITGGTLIIDKGNDQYYLVSILSGNKNFFKAIELLKINDLTLASADHTWNVATMAGTHAADLAYVYPLLEPSNDGSITPAEDDGDRVDMYGGYIWPFIKVKTIWDEIFANAGFTCEGDILTDEIFTRLYIPISSRTVTKAYTDRYLYSSWWQGPRAAALNDLLGATNFPGTLLQNGDENFRLGYYYAPYAADYKIIVTVIVLGMPPTLAVYRNGGFQGNMIITSSGLTAANYEFTVSATPGQWIGIFTSAAYYYFWFVRYVEIINPLIAYGSVVTAKNHLPAISQTDFIKMICNMFGLIPDVTPRDRVIKFWNYLDLYENIPRARDWSVYLSENEDEAEFKFGDYARDNYLRYRESEDVIKDTGTGSMQIDDNTLPTEQDVVEHPFSTCDEVTILSSAEFDVNVSRIAMNIYNIDDSVHEAAKTIDPRIVYVDHIRSIASPPYEKTLGLRATVAPSAITDIDSPKISKSMDVSFSNLVSYYAGLSRLLTKTNLRRAKFNLPVYEVAGLKHYIPIYLSQYKAYFYVNKINNYVPGKLCTIDLIKL